MIVDGSGVQTFLCYLGIVAGRITSEANNTALQLTAAT